MGKACNVFQRVKIPCSIERMEKNNKVKFLTPYMHTVHPLKINPLPANDFSVDLNFHGVRPKPKQGRH